MLRISTYPLTTKESLFTINNLSYEGPTSREFIASGTIESREIRLPSEYPYGLLTFAIEPSGSVTIVVKLKYRVGSSNLYTDPITIATVTTSTNKGYAYRLDAILGINWIPNQTMIIQFVETGGLNGGTITGEMST